MKMSCRRGKQQEAGGDLCSVGSWWNQKKIMKGQNSENIVFRHYYHFRIKISMID